MIHWASHPNICLYLHFVIYNLRIQTTRSKLRKYFKSVRLPQRLCWFAQCSTLMFVFVGENEGSCSGTAGTGTPTQLNPIQRKKKPKRRSTGVVNIEIEVRGRSTFSGILIRNFSFQEIDFKSEDSGDEVSDFQHTRLLVLLDFCFLNVLSVVSCRYSINFFHIHLSN